MLIVQIGNGCIIWNNFNVFCMFQKKIQKSTRVYNCGKRICELINLSSFLVTCSQYTCSQELHCSQRTHSTFFPLKCWILQGAAAHFSPLFTSMGLMSALDDDLSDTQDCGLGLGLGSGLAWSSPWSLLSVYGR